MGVSDRCEQRLAMAIYNNESEIAFWRPFISVTFNNFSELWVSAYSGDVHEFFLVLY